jgi:uncharacterized protein YneR
MKNLYLIPTDKPSRLLKTMPKGNLILSKSITSGSHWENQNIYMTSNEEIKMDDWYLDDTNSVRQSITECESYWTHRKKYQKIILTTDQDLIKDGVQAIDDDFLEWFVRNPSCEWVKVRKNPKVHFIVKGKGVKGFNQGYKIIIPKEEPKQETLEEAAENKFGKVNPTLGKSDYRMGYESGLIAGAKWQQERMYSEEEIKSAFKIGFNIGYGSPVSELDLKQQHCDKWFEQFKKK